MSDLWSGFEHDPRDPAHASMRASDRDREVILRVLGDAYADGRLTRAEYDERSDQLGSVRTLGQLTPLVADLMPSTALEVGVTPLPAPADVRAQAVAKFHRERREAFGAFFTASLVCWVIWLATSWGDPIGFVPWPVWVMLVTGGNLIRVHFQRDEIIDSETKRLTKKAEKARRKELEKKPDLERKPNDEDA